MVWGDYGLRMADHHRRVSASQLKIGEEAIKVRLKGMRYRLYKRVCASIGVYSSGNEVCFDQLGHGIVKTNEVCRSVWVKEREASIIGLPELLLARSYSN